MPIILRIREFFKLEEKQASIDTNLADSIGLYLTEGMIRKREDEPSMDCLINHAKAINVHHDFLQNCNSIDGAHHSHDMHF